MSDDNNDSQTCLQRARTIWLSENCDFQEVERLYRQVWRGKTNKNSAKKRKLSSLSKEQLQAGEKLALLLLQSNRTSEADDILLLLGYICRLASNIVNYPDSSSPRSTYSNDNDDMPCRIWNDFLTPCELSFLQKVFADIGSTYYTKQNYSIEPPSPYYSFLIPLDRTISEFGCLGKLIRRIQETIQEWMPQVRQCTFCEMWAHNRPHATGHQLHFDSDNEGKDDMIRNPIVSTILYLSSQADGGSPSLITNQRLNSLSIASKGWLAFPKEGRLVAFDGKVLHGVLPGKAATSKGAGRRVTLMLAFWRRIQVRDEPTPGAARPFPSKQVDWAAELTTKLAESDNAARTPTVPAQPIPLDHVYETVPGAAPWTRAMGMPGYDQVFQGF